MKKLVCLLTAMILLTLLPACAAEEAEEPPFLAQYADWYEEDGWYVACEDPALLTAEDRFSADFDWTLLDENGRVLLTGLRWTDDFFAAPFIGFEGEADLAAFHTEAGWGFIDRTGTVVVEPLYDSVGDFFEGLADVQSGGKWGFVDRTGAVVAEPQYDDVESFSEGLAAVEAGGKWGFVDRTGAVVVEPMYDSVRDFSEGLAAVEAGGKWGFVDSTGALAVEPLYDSVDDFSEGLAAVKAEGKWGFIDRTGDLAVEPRFDDVNGFTRAGFAVVWQDSIVGV
ncbi:MAG: WG repeat-containing protein, partial [Clostridia bacterium]|nr:WG repeat-containing protein [Clostridia bacterium]